MIYRQIYRRADLTSFDVDPKVHRSLEYWPPARAARSVVRTTPDQGHREVTTRFKFYRQTDSSAEPAYLLRG